LCDAVGEKFAAKIEINMKCDTLLKLLRKGKSALNVRLALVTVEYIVLHEKVSKRQVIRRRGSESETPLPIAQEIFSCPTL